MPYYCKLCYLRIFLYHNLNDQKFIENTIFHSGQKQTFISFNANGFNNKTLHYNWNISNNHQSHSSKAGNILEKILKNNFTFLHINIRSIKKKYW